MEKTIRGYAIASTLAYIDNTYDEATKQKILGGMSPAAREALRDVNDVAWYRVEYASELFHGIVQHHQQTDGKPEEALDAVGKTIARKAMSSFLRLLMKLMTPPLFARKVGDFWSRDNRCGTLEAEYVDGRPPRIRMVQQGLSDFPYIAGVARGFMLAALDAIGCKNARMTTDWTVKNPGADVVHYEATWD